MKKRIILADDHPIIINGLRQIIANSAELELAAAAADGVEAEHLARTVPADLLILDIAMPGRGGVKVLESLRADGVPLPVLFLTMHPADQYVPYIRQIGGQGFIGKEASENVLLAAIHRVLSGRTSFPGAASLRAGNNRLSTLSMRENQVMQGLLRGAPLVEIAAELGIGVKSVSTYRSRLMEKLEIKSNAELFTLIKHE